MRCLRCGNSDTKVLESRLTNDGRCMRRRRACRNCDYRYTTYEREEMLEFLIKKKDGGRIPAFEIMLGTSAIRNLIREDKIPQMYSVIQTGSEKGMCTLDQYLKKLINDNVIDKAVADEVMVHKDNITGV